MTDGRGDERASRAKATLPIQALALLAVFAVTTAIAELAGAANLGTAMGIGQVAFVIALVYLLLRR
jgi:hypothetical protein